MYRLDHRNPVPEALRGAIVALGNFDGFHRGHQAVVGEAAAWAKGEGRPCIVATFDPHPMRFFRPDAEPFRLTTLDQRQELFAAAGADAMLVFHFDADFAALSAEAFVTDMLAARIGAKGVVTGGDFTFGKGRGGNPATIGSIGGPLGLSARTVEAVHDEGGPISSSRIRAALKAGDCEAAAAMLTRPFALRGQVQHGDKLGRTIGFPTANLPLGAYLRPRYGIYAVTGRVLTGPLADGRTLRGAANLGVRPTFHPPKELLEPFFFDFSGDLYGAEIEVAFHHYLRPEARFDGLEALTEQMRRDCEEARKLLSAPLA
ncbi:MAG: bifunctional riboflavin kinase/FAD synthetase [Novosphingobium sp.]|nr:bifunctional riboflavin kinase/FAD synthetase [Novosphingobium sp.]